MHAADYVVLVLYLVGMGLIGLACSRFVKRQEDYFLGGRGFGKLLQTFAAFGAGTSPDEPIKVGRTVWTSGLSGVWSVFLWLFVTPFYWIFAVWYRRMRHLTLGDWFVERYGSPALGAAYAVFGLTFYMFYLAMSFSAISKVVASLVGVDQATVFGVDVGLEYLLVPLIAVVVLIYGLLGGLLAAYWTDLIQGLCIIALSVILIPNGLAALIERFGGDEPGASGFELLHERLSDDYFNLFSGPLAGEFPLHYIVSISLLALVGIVVQPHFIATGGGSAKTEFSARVGLVTGNFLKRFCSVGWAITALIAIGLLADDPRVYADPDLVWGAATQALLGPGLVGLMLSCLLAALMSSADTQMVVGSALIVRNLYVAYFDPNATERRCLLVGRISGAAMVVGAVAASLFYMDVFGQFQIVLELLVVFAAPFWLGMFWRRANAAAAWVTVGVTLFVFFIAPIAAPRVFPQLLHNPRFAIRNDTVITEIVRERRPADDARLEAWHEAVAEAEAIEDEDRREAALKALGGRPWIDLGDGRVQTTFRSGGSSVFWSDGVTSLGDIVQREVDRVQSGDRTVIVLRDESLFRASDLTLSQTFRIDYLLYELCGFDLQDASTPLLATLRLPPRLLTPFLIMIVVSWLTPGPNRERIDRYYAKMRTPVHPDREQDLREVEASQADVERFAERRLFPSSQWEFLRPTAMDAAGFVISWLVCFAILACTAWLASLGSAP